MDENDFEGTLALVALAHIDKVEEFFGAVDDNGEDREGTGQDGINSLDSRSYIVKRRRS